MKRGDEALNASLLHRYDFFSALNVSSPLISIGKDRLTLHRRYFLKEIHRLTLHRRYFLN
jgi:hypothetical protein